MEPADMEQLIRATYARWSRGDQSFDPETMHPEIEIRSVAGMLTGRTYRGREGVEQWTSDVNESFDEWTVESTSSSTRDRGGCSRSAASISGGVRAAW
jgi:ketosteroid isomerase-like protein